MDERIDGFKHPDRGESKFFRGAAFPSQDLRGQIAVKLLRLLPPELFEYLSEKSQTRQVLDVTEEERLESAIIEQRHDSIVVSPQPSRGDQTLLDPLPCFIRCENADPMFEFIPADRRRQ